MLLEIERLVYCEEEIVGETWTGVSGFSGSEKDDIGEPTEGD